jgi:hypothetical protein
VGSAHGPSQHGHDGGSDEDDEERGQRRAREVVAQRRRQVEDAVALRVGGRGRTRYEPGAPRGSSGGQERPEPEVQQSAVGQARDDPVCGEEPPLRAFADRGQQGRPQRDPAAPNHLERQPWADAAGEERTGQQREAPEQERLARPQHPSADDEQEEQRFESRRSGGQHPQGAPHRGEDAEGRNRLGVEPVGGQLGDEDDGQQGEEHGEHPRGVVAVLLSDARVGEERPEEGREPDQADQTQRKHGRRMEPQPRCHDASPSAASTSATVR